MWRAHAARRWYFARDRRAACGDAPSCAADEYRARRRSRGRARARACGVAGRRAGGGGTEGRIVWRVVLVADVGYCTSSACLNSRHDGCVLARRRTRGRGSRVVVALAECHGAHGSVDLVFTLLSRGLGLDTVVLKVMRCACKYAPGRRPVPASEASEINVSRWPRLALRTIV